MGKYVTFVFKKLYARFKHEQKYGEKLEQSKATDESESINTERTSLLAKNNSGAKYTEKDANDEEESVGWLTGLKPHFSQALEKTDDLDHNLDLHERLKRSQSAYFFPKLHRVAISQPVAEKNEGSLIVDNHFKPSDDMMMDVEEEEDDNRFILIRWFFYFLDWIDWSDKNWFEKFTYFFEAPTVLARNLTIPKADPEDWSRFFAVMNPVFAPLISMVILRCMVSSCIINCICILDQDATVGPHNFPVIVIVLIVGVCCSLVVLVTTENRRPPRYHFVCAVNCMH